MTITLFLLILIVAIAFYFISIFNRLKTIQANIKSSIQEIGNQLKRQMLLLPNAATAVKNQKTFEKDIYKMLTDARKGVAEAMDTNNTGKIDQSQEMVSKALGSIKVVLESNPELKTAEISKQYLSELSDTSDKLMYSRRTLIDLTRDYNTIINTIPSGWVASFMGFKEEKGLDTPVTGEHLTVTEDETKKPNLDIG
ncbi:MAG: LemA family protein [Candidatus Shapirobacteria bacterium]|jgi:LemA protein